MSDVDAKISPPPTYVFMLEELCHAEEQGSGLLSGESLPNIEQEYNSRQERSAFAGRDG